MNNQHPAYHHNGSVLDYIKGAMMRKHSADYHPSRTFRQRLQFQLAAAQNQREAKHWPH